MLGLDNKVKFWGFVSEKKKFDLLQRSLLVINPSVREGWGLTVIEAAFVGTPTIGYKVPGLKDAIVHMETGVLVAKNSPDYLAQAVKELLDHKTKYFRMQKAAQKWAAGFKWQKSTQLSTKLIEKQIERIDS